MSSNHNDGAGALGAIALAVLTCGAATLVLAPIGDRPNRVHPDEPFMAELGQWASVLAWTLISVFAVMTGAWGAGIVLSLFTAFLMTRRVCATGSRAYPLRMSAFATILAETTVARVGAGAIALGVLASFTSPFEWGREQGLPVAALVALAAIPAGAWFGWTLKNVWAKHDAEMAQWAGTWAAILGVTPALITEQGGVRLMNNGSVMLAPVPSQVAVKVAGRLHEFDDAVAAVAPGYVLHRDGNESAHERLDLIPVTEEIRLQREARRATGGLLGGQVDDGVTAPIDDGTPGLLRLTDEDLA